jgi:hypothetical protein
MRGKWGEWYVAFVTYISVVVGVWWITAGEWALASFWVWCKWGGVYIDYCVSCVGV